MTRRATTRTLTFTVVVLALASPAIADTITIQQLSLGLSEDVKYRLNGTTGVIAAGRFDLTSDGLYGEAFAIDLQQASAASWTATTQSLNVRSRRGKRVAYLYDIFADRVTTDTEAAAFQAAIWESQYDSKLDPDSGRFRVTGSVSFRTQLDTYLGALSSMAKSYVPQLATKVLQDSGSTGQNLIVPEAPSLVPLVLGTFMYFLFNPQHIKKRSP